MKSFYEAKRQVTSSAYNTTVLYDTPTLFNTNSEIELNDVFDQYDELKIYMGLNDNGIYEQIKAITIPKDILLQSYHDYNDPTITQSEKGRFPINNHVYACNDYIMCWQLVAKDYDVLLCAFKDAKNWNSNICYIYKIVGVKYHA